MLASACAVVIAAGAGSRLRASSNDDTIVKPVTPLLGVPLIVRTLATLRSQGAEEAIIVTGYRAEELTGLLPREPLLAGFPLRFVHNDEWQKSNGVSVLAARAAVGERPFFLSMADHVYSADVVRALRDEPPGPRELVLAIDRRVAEITDPDDAMWVKLVTRMEGAREVSRIAEIGKHLTDFDAVDTGVFLTTPALFEALQAERETRGGDCALADGVRRMAREGRARVADIGDAWWQDVDTRENLVEAEAKLRQAGGEGEPGSSVEAVTESTNRGRARGESLA